MNERPETPGLAESTAAIIVFGCLTAAMWLCLYSAAKAMIGAIGR